MAYNYEFPYTDPNRYNDDWLLKTVKEVDRAIISVLDWQREHEKAFDDWKKLYNQIIKGNFPKSIEAGFYKWMSENALDLVGSLVKNVFFGINDDGYFVAYIPESWKDITFKTTGLDIIEELQPEYGHLVLLY